MRLASHLQNECWDWTISDMLGKFVLECLVDQMLKKRNDNH